MYKVGDICYVVDLDHEGCFSFGKETIEYVFDDKNYQCMCPCGERCDVFFELSWVGYRCKNEMFTSHKDAFEYCLKRQEKHNKYLLDKIQRSYGAYIESI